MSRLLISVTSFAACVVGGQSLHYAAVHLLDENITRRNQFENLVGGQEDNMPNQVVTPDKEVENLDMPVIYDQEVHLLDEENTRWNPFENIFGAQEENSLNEVVTPDKQVDYLEEGFFDAFVNVYDGDLDQSNAARFMDACKGMKVDLTKMGHIENAGRLMSRIEHNRLQVYKAQHLKSLFENGSMPKGPNWIFVINETGPFQPPWNEHPMDLAEWYMSKAAALDAMSERAIATKENLDLVFHFVRQFEFAMGLVSKRNVFLKPTSDTALAKKTMEALLTHLTHLEERLHKGGAIPGAYFKRANVTASEGESAEEESASFGVYDGDYSEEDFDVVTTVDGQDPVDWNLDQEGAADRIFENELASVNVTQESASVGTVDQETAANLSLNDESAVIGTVETNPSLNDKSAVIGSVERQNAPDFGVSGDGTAEIRRELMEALGAHYN